MFFRQYQLACLSHFSYLIGDETTGRAVVVDPQRDVSGYLADAAANGLVVEGVIETHFHADFLSGHLELAAATGAAISYGDAAHPDFEIEPLGDGERLSLGAVNLEIRHTPGHTPEAISIVVRRRPDAEPWAVLTGDTLFIGDVGRPDLATSVGWSAPDLARALRRSLQTQLLTLPDATRVYPAHGAGSACGKQLSTDTVSTIGAQRADNHALAPMTEDAFIELLTQGLAAPPPYFAFAADANRHHHDLLDDHQAPDRLGIDAVNAARRDAGAVIVDARPPEAFAAGHLKGSINVGLDGRFAEFVGDVIKPEQPVVIVADPGRELETRVRLARIGFDRVIGYLHIEATLACHPDLAARAHRVTASAVDGWRAERPGLQIVDVRSPTETSAGTLPGAHTIPLAALVDSIDTLDPQAPTLVYCAGGYRSSIGASTLRAHGFGAVADLIGGYSAWTDHQRRQPSTPAQ
ncbi:MAG: rhodanese-like domain-containing protein [Actinomycetota bacterium]|nr:rhodanese-like domain-containing protein [Actinomycetota bacterium]